MKGVFPSEEAGRYFNENFVNLKYELDIDQRDNIKEMGVEAYPTIIFLNSDGTEFSRIVGGGSDPKVFVERVKKAVLPDNSWKVVKEKYSSDPAFVIKYLSHLQKSGMRREAKSLLREVFEKRSVAENFNPESVEYYRENIDDVRDKIIVFMLENEEQVSAVMGKKEYQEFLAEKGNGYLGDAIFSRSFKETNMINTLNAIGRYKQFQTPFYNYVNRVKNDFVSKDFAKMIVVAKEFIKKSDSSSRVKICQSLLNVSQNERGIIDKNSEELVKFLKKAISIEKNKKCKFTLEQYLSTIKR